jgi:hypothetical protein
MIEDDDLRAWLRVALPRVDEDKPPRDLWPMVVQRGRAGAPWSWFDTGVAAVVATVLLLFPDWIWVLAFHL